MSESDKRIALLIDADNAPAAKVDEILAEVARHGVANVRRAYGNWKSPHLKSWEAVLHEYAIRPIQQFAYSKGKNASDMAMVIDAMDLLYARNLDGFAIVSSDADFTPLVMRLLTDGVKVYGFGEQKTPLPFVNACSKFTYLEALGQDGSDDEHAVAESENTESARQGSGNGHGNEQAVPPASEPPQRPIQPRTGNELRSDARLLNLLRGAMDAAADEQGWASLSAVGNQIANRASFDSRNYGYRKLSDLIAATELFELKKEGKATSMRALPKKKPATRARARKARPAG
ncbi:NYN domain-containing protein [Stenotrophomonas sp. Marseille-Q4652]|uniref:NYN domain-containing protein n=1 Tax=Stenotrophomonas sp. Marseille-Q4652 TaxID=2866595 RepID=UPI001CE3BD57|nr:NYN domain-containing protein [Stenotrophomonas sp. Marseille-Q4652]